MSVPSVVPPQLFAPDSSQAASTQVGTALASPGAGSRPADTPAKIRDAAQQFEALLIGQILRDVRESGGWLGTSDPASDSATEFAEQQLALAMARSGGLGLADVIAQGLEPQTR